MLLSFWVANDIPPFFDAPIYNMLSPIINPQLTQVVILITDIGDVQVLLPLCLGLMLAFWMSGQPQKSLVVAGHLAASAVLCNLVLKNIFSRQRPLDIMLVQEHTNSFPSGHSFVSMAFYSLLIYLIITHIKHPVKWVMCGLVSLLILAIGLSRIYLGVHYPSDVVAGFCGGLLCTLGMVNIPAVRKVLTPKQ